MFRHKNGMSGQHYMVEMTGSGVALLDYDNDGDLDVFALQSGPLEKGRQPDPLRDPTSRLFRNDLQNGSLHFTDVTEQAGLGLASYAQGVAVADFDGDGFADLYVTTFGRNHLFHNNGNGTFTDVTEQAGVADSPAWHTCATFIDYDRDGWPDLFVCRYLLWTLENHHTCTSSGGLVDYCGPQSYSPDRSRLYHNLGGGRFEDVSVASGIAGNAGSALGVLSADFNGDGWPDLFVANDGAANFVWINQRNGTFREEGMLRGAALNGDGAAEANMGVVAADFSNRGLLDLFVTHLRNEHSTLWRNLGGGLYEDNTQLANLDAPTRPFTGFGTVAVDYDNDGWLDLFAANGDVHVIDEQARAGVQLPLRQRAMLLRNLGGDPPRFQEIVDGDFIKVKDVGRGVASGDLNNDGAVDLVVANNNGPLRLLLNQAAGRAKWLGVRLTEGPAGHRHDALGATATLHRTGRPSQFRRCGTDGSYLSASDPRIVFGLGDSAAYDWIDVQWADGLKERFTGVPTGRYSELAKGHGQAQ
ncbi:MAG TPA: CRTAC1 family protein [Bryobacteraceae bacterium]|nr:CRTAC1 family protein [Bryobacteraceae bacterium]